MDRRIRSRAYYYRRRNWLGRWVVDVHRKYYMPDLKPVVWILFVATTVLEIILVASAR
jgi:hypothetical protein